MGLPKKTGASSTGQVDLNLAVSHSDKIKDLTDQLTGLEEQVKDLVRAESKLHRIQNDLDHQLKIFGKLHEFGLKITSSVIANEIQKQVAAFAVYELNYQRCLILHDFSQSSKFQVGGSEGFYSDEERKRFSTLIVARSHPIIKLTEENTGFVFTRDMMDADLQEFSSITDLGEFISFPLCPEEHLGLKGILIAGNSREESTRLKTQKIYVEVDKYNHSGMGLANLSAQCSAALNNALNHQALEIERNLLEVKVQERTQALEKTFKDLEELDNAKSKFFANISHELRTPLTLSIAPLEEIMRGGSPISTETRHRYIQVIYSNQLRLLKLINNLLDFAKIDAGKITAKFQELNMLEVLRYYFGTIESATQSRQITTSFSSDSDDVKVYIDRDKFEKIIMNLLSNAFKFTGDGGSISIAVLQSADSVSIDVRDSGIGIPEDKIDKLFSRFTQLDSSAKRQYEGTGIGLSLAKEYTELHGGMITVTSVLGKGTTFRVKLPLGKEHLPEDSIIESADEESYTLSADSLVEYQKISDDEQDIVPEFPLTSDNQEDETALVNEGKLIGESPASQRKPLVLVVDDVADMRQFIAQVLRGYYLVKTAKDGLEGLAMTKKFRPDIVVSDVMMPNMTGYELCESIKQSQGSIARTPIILLSAKADQSQKLEGLEHGADDYLVKPFNANELVARVKNLIKMRDSERQLYNAQVRLVEEQRKTFDAEINAARIVQAAILPKNPELKYGPMHLKGSLVSATQCSGDFWTYRKLPDGRLLIAIGDVTGHGLASAMVTEQVAGGLNALCRLTNIQLTPSFLLSELNAILCEDISTLWMSMIIGLFDPEKNEVQWSNAGHPPGMYCIENGKAEFIYSSGTNLGAHKESTYHDLHIKLHSKSRFFIFTDGIVEAGNPGKSGFGLRRLSKHFEKNKSEPKECLDAIWSELVGFTKGDKFEDDIALVWINFDPSIVSGQGTPK